MAAFLTKWQDLAKAYQKAIKGEQLWSKEIQGVNREMLKIVKELDQAEADISNACGGTRGKKQEDAPGYLVQFASRAKLLKAKGHKNTVMAEVNGTNKGTSPKTYRALKVLATGIDDIASLAEYKYKTFKDQVADIGKIIATQQRIQRVQDLSLKQVKKGVMKSLACIQKMKSDPTPENWKNMMNAGMTRDLIMSLTTLVKAQGSGAFGGVPLGQPHKSATSPWNTGQPTSSVADDANPATVNAKVKAWSQLVKAVAGDYQAHW